jgi:hypothetical protein
MRIGSAPLLKRLCGCGSAGWVFRAAIAEPGFESDHAYRIAYDFLSASPRPSAMMAGGLPIVRVMRAARALGIAVPQDLSLISFGDTDFVSPVPTLDRRTLGQPADGSDRAPISCSRIGRAARPSSPLRSCCRRSLSSTGHELRRAVVDRAARRRRPRCKVLMRALKPMCGRRVRASTSRISAWTNRHPAHERRS